MEGMNKKVNLGVPVPSWASETTMPPQFAMLAPPSNLPLLPSTGLNQVWKRKPYFINQGGSSSSRPNKAAYFKPTDDGTVNSVAISEQDDKISSQTTDTNLVVDDGLPFTTENGVKAAGQFQWGHNNPDLNVDPRKLRRTMSNRLSAQRSRTRKLQHIYDMEMSVKFLEAEIAALSPQVMFQHHQQKLLKMENHFLNQQIITCTENYRLKNAQLENNKAEVSRLRQLHMTQLQKLQEQNTTPPDDDVGNN